MSEAFGDRFAFEGLEGRNLLSASVVADLLSSSIDTGVPESRAAFLVASPAPASPSSAAAPVATPYVKRVPPTTPLTGAFNAAGTYSQPFSRNPDAGPLYHFTGSGRK